MIRARCVGPKPFDARDWPGSFCELPSVGHYIENNNGGRMRVVRVTHINVRHAIKTGDMQPDFVELELGPCDS